MDQRSPDFIATLRYNTTEEGGRRLPAMSGYRPQLKFDFSENQSSGEQTFLNREIVNPGEFVQAEIRIASPQIYKYALLKGMHFEFKEGDKVIGTGKITRIVNVELNKKLIIKNRLENHFPILFQLTDVIKIDWEKVYDVFNEKFEYYKSKHEKINALRKGSSHANGENPSVLSFRIQSSFYNIITESMKGDASAIRLREYIENLFDGLNRTLDMTEKRLIKNSIFGFLTNMDKKYLNYLGELSFVNYVKITKRDVKLMATEEPIENENKKGPKIDFRFYNLVSEEHQLVEIVNLHLDEVKEWNEMEIGRLLDQKINEKLNNKQMRQRPEIILVPILWGPWNFIEKVADYYRKNKPVFPNTFIPFCYIPFTDQNGDNEHIFGSIDSIFNLQ